MTPARILECTVAEYHADPFPTPTLSASLATTIATKSPQHAWLEHPKLGGTPRKATKATDDGTIIHGLLLGETGEIVVVNADNYKTKAAQEARDGAHAAGATPVLARELDEARGVVEKLRWRLADLEIDLSGTSEVKVAWEYETEEGVIDPCRSMIDHMLEGGGTVYDLKTIRSAHPKQCSRSAVDYGYDIQWAAYTKAVGRLAPHLIGAVDMIFLFCEIEPPYSVLVARPDGMMRELGAARWERAAATWAKCLATGEWPGYATAIVPLTVPSWALMDEGLTAAGFI